jgi:hypothetical protein
MKNLNEQIERMNRISNYKVGVVISEQKKDLWDNFVSVMLTMTPKPKLSTYEMGRPEETSKNHLGWFNDVNHFYSVSINNSKEEISINAQVKKNEITEWWKNKGYSFSSLTSIPISFDNPQKVKNDLIEFFNSFPSK